jgi:NAD(P)-dependent dehydrogenase (short-subunit alcohol dehydrogenase family)
LPQILPAPGNGGSGGVLTTGFGKRTASEASLMPAAPEDYSSFIAGAHKVFGTMRAARLATAEEVARVIVEAASDESHQLRYVATKDIEPLVKARRETSESRYIEFMRSQFMPC